MNTRYTEIPTRTRGIFEKNAGITGFRNVRKGIFEIGEGIQ